MRFLKISFLIPMIFCIMGASNCSQIKYKSDSGLMAPYQAGILEFLVKINGHNCKDMSGSIGSCTLQLSTRNNIKIAIMAQKYDYSVHLVCSSNINYEYSNDIPKNLPHVIEINKEIYAYVTQFICIGKITPSDRDFMSARWEMRIRVFNGQYVQRANGFIFKKKKKTYLNLGKHAKYVWVYDKDKWKYHRKRPVIRVRGDLNKLQAYSESEIMRFNYYNF